MNESELRIPGEVLGWESEYVAGTGTYIWQRKVYASVVGFQRVIPPAQGAGDERPTVEIKREKQPGAVPEVGAIVTAKITKLHSRMASADIVCVGPRVVKEKFTGIIRQQDVRATEIDKVDMHTSFRPGDIVRAEVMPLSPYQSKISLPACFRRPLVCRMLLRSFHVQAGSPKRVLPHETSSWETGIGIPLRCYFVKELSPLSLGDARAYYLSTAKDELGVVAAKSNAGEAMVPVSWQEMQCPVTGQKEPRKVAKVL